MSKTITLSISDAEYEALQSAATQTRQSPEDVAAGMIADRLGGTSGATSGATTATDLQQAKQNFLALMRAQGYLVDPAAAKPYPASVPLPPKGSPEEARLLDEIGDELSDALDRSGMSILDLIDRR